MVRQPSERKGWEGGARAALAGGAGPAAIRRFDEKLVLEKLRRGAGGELHDALRLAVWDFGGQDNFYALHLLFLSRISVVLLPLNMSNFVKAADPAKRDASLRFVRFWLSSIYAATADPATGASPAPVFLVGTHKDEVSTPEQHQEVSEYLYEQLCGNPAWSAVVPFRKGEVATGRGLLWFFPVDNTRGNDDRVVQELKLAIEKQIEGEDYVKQRIPFTWMALYDALQSPERQQAKTLPLDECLALGESLGMGQGSVGIADEVRACLLFFNALGFVMYFDEPGLRDLVILNPVEFLIEPITKVICDYKIHVVDEHEDVKKKFPIEFLELQNHGVLHHKILPKLWAAFDNRDELEQLAVKFGLMVPLLSDAPSGGEAVADNSASVRYLVPSVLSSRTLERARTPPQLTAFIVFAARGKIESWGQATDLQAVVREGFFPLGVFARLVCRAVGWMQTVRGQIPAAVLQHQLSAKEARLLFGQHEFTLVLSEAQGCVRVEIAGPNPREVVHRLQRLLGGDGRRDAGEAAEGAGGVLEECAAGIGARVAVPIDGGDRKEGYAEYDGALLILDDKLVGIATDVEGHVDLRSGATLKSDKLRERFKPWLPPRQLREWYPPPHPPPPPRTNRTRRVPHPVLIGHAASLSQVPRVRVVPPRRAGHGADRRALRGAVDEKRACRRRQGRGAARLPGPAPPGDGQELPRRLCARAGDVGRGGPRCLERRAGAHAGPGA